MAQLDAPFGLGRRGTAALLERAVGGDAEASADPRIRDLVPTARALAGLEPTITPDPVFVAALAARLQQEAASVLGTAPVAARPARAVGARRDRAVTAPRADRGPHPVIVFIGRGVPRLLAGVAASLVAVAAIVGVSSQSSLPGQILYPVKQVIDSARVGLAGSDLDKGRTLLAQAEGNVVEVSELVDGQPSPSDVNQALRLAIDRTTRGQVLLRSSASDDHEQQALVALRDFSTRMVPQVDALRDRMPAESLATLDQLRALLDTVTTQTSQDLASCLACAPATSSSGAPGASPGAPGAVGAVPSSGSTPGVGSGVATSAGGQGAASAPSTATTTTAPGAPGGAVGTVAPPSVGVSAPAGSAGVTLPGVGVDPTGATVGGGGVGATVPGVSATVGVPTVTAGTGGVGVGGGGIGVGLPGSTATLPLPGVTVGTGTVGVGGLPVVSNTCVLGICPHDVSGDTGSTDPSTSGSATSHAGPLGSGD